MSGIGHGSPSRLGCFDKWCSGGCQHSRVPAEHNTALAAPCPASQNKIAVLQKGVEAMSTRERIDEMIGDFLDTCVDQGLKRPFLLWTVASNGTFTVARLDGEETEMLAEHTVGGGFSLPFNLVVSDAAGQLASGKITKKGLTTYH
jgi:hypothetical protein